MDQQLIPDLNIIPEEIVSSSYEAAAPKRSRPAANSGLSTQPQMAEEIQEMGEMGGDELINNGAIDDILDTIEKGSEGFNEILALRLKIDVYLKHFKEELKWHAPDNEEIKRLSVQDLQNICEKFDIIIGAASSVTSSKKTINGSIYALETALAYFDIDVTGATTTLLRDEVFQKSVLHYAVKSGNFNNIKPEITIPMTIATTFLQAYANNQAKKETINDAPAKAEPKPQRPNLVVQQLAPSAQPQPQTIDKVNSDYADL